MVTLKDRAAMCRTLYASPSSIWNRHGGVEALLTNQETGIFSHIGVSDSTSIPNLFFFITSMTVSEYYLCLIVFIA